MGMDPTGGFSGRGDSARDGGNYGMRWSAFICGGGGDGVGGGGDGDGGGGHFAEWLRRSCKNIGKIWQKSETLLWVYGFFKSILEKIFEKSTIIFAAFF